MVMPDIIGSIGVIMMLVVFILNIMDKLSNDSPFYIVMNLIGAGLACTASVMINYVPFIVLEGTWTIISVWALYVYFTRDFKKTANKLKCKKSLYKSTYKGNAFTKGHSYIITSEDDIFLNLQDNEGNEFNFKKIHSETFYYINDYFNYKNG
jgi:hypothetical protein